MFARPVPLLLQAMSNNADSQLLGVVLIARHGDRQGFYQDPESYTPSATSITPLGEVRFPLLFREHCWLITTADARVPAGLVHPLALPRLQLPGPHQRRRAL